MKKIATNEKRLITAAKLSRVAGGLQFGDPLDGGFYVKAKPVGTDGGGGGAQASTTKSAATLASK